MSWFLATLAAAIALASLILTVTRPNVIHALLYFLAALIAVAAAFFALGAAFAGAVQLLIYAGAVVAVFVFVAMTMDTSDRALARERAGLAAAWKAPAILAGVAVLPVVLVALLAGTGPGSPASIGGKELGLLLFGPWALVTELISLLLLAGILGVRHLARRPARHARGAGR